MIGEMSITPVVTIAPDASIRDATRLMRTKKVGALVVTNSQKPIGVLTDRDITVDVVAAGSDPATTPGAGHRLPAFAVQYAMNANHAVP